MSSAVTSTSSLVGIAAGFAAIGDDVHALVQLAAVGHADGLAREHERDGDFAPRRSESTAQEVDVHRGGG